MTEKSQYAIGLMSGTSVDALDGVLIGYAEELTGLQVVAAVTEKFTPTEKKLILKNMSDDTSAISELCALNVTLSHKAARVVKKLLQKANLNADQVNVIGFHGQT